MKICTDQDIFYFYYFYYFQSSIIIHQLIYSFFKINQFITAGLAIRYTLSFNYYLQQYKKFRQTMGCGAICASSSSVAESSKQAHQHFLNLFKHVTPNQYLYPVKAIVKFTKEMKLYPHRLQLVLVDKLESKNLITTGVMQKWKIILFGLDFDRPTYVNCLGYPVQIIKSKDKLQKDDDEQKINKKAAAEENKVEQIELIQHQAFAQIEKDIQRTFPGINFEKKSFTTILKRITNHFPQMGYTQGINFIVGYLLIIGYSQSDAFWLFIHLAINRRYLLLGFYEEGFPLIFVYTSIFKNMLKRLNKKLYSHLYETVSMFQQSVWVFKWFMTCFLSSFPIEMCQYVWDIVLSIGGIGLIKFALSLVLKLEPCLLIYQDACDLCQFLNNLKSLDTFNHYVNIREVVNSAYKIKLQKEDLSEINKNNNTANFYSQYVLSKFQQQNQENEKQEENPLKVPPEQLHETNPILMKKLSGRKSTQVINQWYQKLIRERLQFKHKFINVLSPVSYPAQQTIILQNSQLTNNNANLSQTEETQECHNNVERVTSRLKTSVKELSIKKKQNLQSIEYETKNKVESPTNSPVSKLKTSINNNRYSSKKQKAEDIVMWKDDDSQQSIQEIKDKMGVQDELSYIPQDIRFKRKNISYQSDDTLSEFSNKYKYKVNNSNNFQAKPIIHNQARNKKIVSSNQSQNQSRLARVGNSVLSNMSVSNASNKSSNSSYGPIKKKQNEKSIRYCNCAKNKTEEHQLQVSQPKLGTSKRIEKGGYPQQNNIEYEQTVDLTRPRKKLKSHVDWMVNSQGPRQINNLQSSNVKQPSQIGSEIQIVHGRQMFKKKVKINKANGGIDAVVHNCPHLANQQQNSECESRHIPTPAFGQQESCESFFLAYPSSHKSERGEAESVK